MTPQSDWHPLKVWRLANGLSQAEAARKFRVSQPMWHYLETERKYAMPDLAMRLSRETGVPFERLLRLRDNERRAKKRRQARKAA